MKIVSARRNLIIILSIIIFVVLIVFFNTVFSIKYGSVGIITRFGEVTGRIVEPGLHFKVPFVDNVVTYRTQKITYETLDDISSSNANYKDYPVDTTTKDGQQVQVRYTIRFAIDPAQASWIANNIGTEEDVVEKIIKTESRIYVRNVIREYYAENLYTGNIVDAQTEVEGILAETFNENGIILDSFGIRQIEFQPEYISAIEAKQIEKERVTTEQYKAEQEEFKKQQAITKAQGEAEAQRLQQQTLSPELIQKLWIEKWNGQLPNYLGGNESLFVGLP
ncbi:MAG: prohibitin family protein [Candidatus Dojkabacteria bacterium]